jgi:hypothetical protein
VADINELKRMIDLHDLAEKLGLERDKDGGNYKSPHHKDKNPSLSVFNDGKAWKDHSGGGDNHKGSCIDLVCYVEGCDVTEAMRRLHDLYNIPFTQQQKKEAPREKSLAEHISKYCFGNVEPVREYLSGRGIIDSVLDYAIKSKSVGFNDYKSKKREPGERFYGGPAAAFIVHSLDPGHVVAVDTRYFDPELNGGLKTQCHGEKDGYPWTVNWLRLKKKHIHTVYIVESPINALSVESCRMPGVMAIAMRGTAGAGNIDWRFLMGKQVVICPDNDLPDDKGVCAGQSASWVLYERLTALNIAASIIDQSKWEHNDANDILVASGADELQRTLRLMQQWAIPGMPGNRDLFSGKPRVILPPHDFAFYGNYRTKDDFTSIIKSRSSDGEGEDQISFDDVCGFRIAAITRISISSVTATMTGETDLQPRTLFAVATQVPRHGPKLIRRVFDDETLYNITLWNKFGPIFKPTAFNRLINMLERTAHLGERKAINFVGLAWQDGKPVVNEGSDCYFNDPSKQCPYHNLTFPSGSTSDARRVIEAYQSTFKDNAAMQALAWSLGGHLKAFLGFWPHMIMQANKGAGKSTLLKTLERTINFTMFSGQSLQTEFRLLTSICHTSHPVGWEEISAREQRIIDKAVSMLQESYQYTTSRRNTDMTEYLLSAPVMLAGEDVPVRSLLGKVVRSDLTNRKGDPISDDLPRFPVLQWLRFLSEFSRVQVKAVYQEALTECLDLSRASGTDNGATRMAGNYAAVLTAWRLLCEFAGISPRQGDFERDILKEMNIHIAETSTDREPWVWIMETLLSEIEANNIRHPYAWQEVEGELCLCIKTSHVMDHLSGSMSLREKWNMLPVKSDRVFKRQLKDAGVIIKDRCDVTSSKRRYYHLTAISVEKLNEYGLHCSPDVAPETIE